MADYSTVSIIVNSADRYATGPAYDFVQALGQEVLDQRPADEYEVALRSIELSGHPPTNILVFSSLAARRPVGSQFVQLLAEVPSTIFYDVAGDATNQATFEPQFVPLAVSPPVRQVDLTLTSFDNQPINTTLTRATLLIRRRHPLA